MEPDHDSKLSTLESIKLTFDRKKLTEEEEKDAKLEIAFHYLRSLGKKLMIIKEESS